MNEQTGPVRFGSKVDPMIVAVMAGSFALPVAIGISRFLRSGTLWPNLVLLLILIPVGALELFLIRNTYYLVTDDELIVHCLFRTAIPLGGIQTLRPTRKPARSARCRCRASR